MRIDDAEGRGLLLQILDDERQNRVLENISEIPGMVDVAIVHGRIRCEIEPSRLVGTGK